MARSKDSLKRALKLNISTNVLIGLFLFGYLILATVQVMWRNHTISLETDRLEEEIANLQQENHELENLIAYLNTRSFQEKEARRKLGFKKPDEKVIFIPQERYLDLNTGDILEEGVLEEAPITNYEKWWEFIFG